MQWALRINHEYVPTETYVTIKYLNNIVKGHVGGNIYKKVFEGSKISSVGLLQLTIASTKGKS